MRAAARKSFGEFKPMIIHKDGRTEIVGQRGRVEQIQPQTKFYSGPSEVYRARRGVTFSTKDEAVAFAQLQINARLAVLITSWEAANARHRSHGLPERDLTELYELRAAQPTT